ncbi:MAG: NRDE family protein [Chromatiales bacterium]|nr:NRDE family protein [Chromatiales bacterium]
MCSVVILRRPDHDWPLLIAANRDEMTNRPWLAPGRHWPELPAIIAGKDQLAGGSWLGMNDNGVVAGVMNRVGTLGSQPGKRSRGELVLQALTLPTAQQAAATIAELPPEAFQAFNLVVADSREAFWIAHHGNHNPMTSEPIPPGLSMLTSMDRNDLRSSRIHTYLPKFEMATEPNPEQVGGWNSWIKLLSSHYFDPASDQSGAMNVNKGEFATLSSALIALPGQGKREIKPIWLFAAGAPDQAPYLPVKR